MLLFQGYVGPENNAGLPDKSVVKQNVQDVSINLIALLYNVFRDLFLDNPEKIIIMNTFCYTK